MGPRRGLVTAERGFAAVALVEVLTALDVAFILRVKGSTKVSVQGQWRKLHTLHFAGTAQLNLDARLVYASNQGCAGSVSLGCQERYSRTSRFIRSISARNPATDK